MKVKEEFIGVRVQLKSIGMVKLREDHINILLREGKTEYLEGAEPEDNGLNSYKDYKKADLVKIAEDLGINPAGMRKQDLIDAIIDITFS